jgi:peptidyl-prolyl cis-trans isomerase D
MFDLFRSREKSVRILLGALLVVVALSMLTYLIPTYDTGSHANETVVATIGGETITTMEVQRAIQTMVKGKQLPPELLATYIPQIVESMVTERAMAFQAERLGYRITDVDVARAIETQIPGLFQDGKFVGKEAYANMLAQQNISIAEFERELKRSLLASRVRNLAAEGVVVLPAEIEAEFRRRNDKTKIEYVKLTTEKYRKDVQVTDDEIRKVFQATTSKYQTPEKRNLAILIADLDKLSESINPTDAELQRIYDQNKESYRTPDRVKVRHILIKTTDKPAGDEPKLKAKAEDLLKQIKAGGNFAELAKKNSEDTGSAQNGGELPGWVTKGQTVPEFEKAAFTLPIGKTSDLVKTQYGFHILQVLKREDAHVREFAEVKGEIADQVKKQRSSELLDQVSSQAQTQLVKDPTSAEKVAAALKLQLVNANNVAPGDSLPEVGSSRPFEDTWMNLKKGEVSQPVALSGTRVVLCVVTGVTPARPSTLEEVKGQIRDSIVTEKVTELLAKRANELADKAKAAGGDLKAAAKALGLEVKTSDDITRNGAVEGVGSAMYLQDAFVKPVGTVIGPLSIADGRVVMRVVAHTGANMAELASQRTAIREELKSRKGRDRSQLFEAGLRQMLIKQGKVKVYQDVVGRLAAGYRGA